MAVLWSRPPARTFIFSAVVLTGGATSMLIVIAALQAVRWRTEEGDETMHSSQGSGYEII